jgi:hypothetical protein
MSADVESAPRNGDLEDLGTPEDLNGGDASDDADLFGDDDEEPAQGDEYGLTFTTAESPLIESAGSSEKSTTLNSTRATMKEEATESHTPLNTAREQTHNKNHSD